MKNRLHDLPEWQFQLLCLAILITGLTLLQVSITLLARHDLERELAMPVVPAEGPAGPLSTATATEETESAASDETAAGEATV